MKEKTLYDILGLTRDASATEIRSAYEALRKRCEDNVAGLDEEERHIQLVVLQQTFETLSNPTAKAIYDAKLMGPAMPDAWAETGDVSASVGDVAVKPRKETNWLAVGVWALLGIAGIWLIAQVSYVFLVSRHLTASPPSSVAEARDKAVIQDYYQETGVRAASAAEVEMLRLADRQAERERRQEELAEREKAQTEHDYERFVAESKRVGEQVSNDLRRAEMEAEMERKYAEERKQREAEEAARRQAAEEEARIERDRARWQEVLRNRNTE